jgi:hypothetical protein
MSGLLDSYGSMTVGIGADARIGCITSPNGVHPILTIDMRHHALALSPAGHKTPITDDDLATAHELARAGP